jgi:predicted phage baseplate assembly protein
VTRIVPTVVAAVHRRKPRDLDATYVNKRLRMWRRLPGNVFALPEGDRPALASSLDVRIQEQGDATPQPWQRVDDFSTSGPDDRVYVFDAAAARLRFGDGVAGKIPILASTSAVTIGYDVGGGTAGNVGNALAWETTAPLLHLTNLVPGTGGTNAETPTDVRARAPALLRWTGRAILASDFETVALQAPGTALARAHAAVGSHPLFPNQVVPGAVTVFVVPDVPRNADDSPSYGTDQPYPAGPVADPPTLDAVLAPLNAARLATSEVYVRPAPYRPVFINVTVAASPADPQALRDAVVQALQRYLDPLVGGDDGTGWPFGGSLRPSSLIRIVQQAAGHAGTVRSVGIILDDPSQPAKSCKDVPILANEVVNLQQVNIALEPPSAGQGGLR